MTNMANRGNVMARGGAGAPLEDAEGDAEGDTEGDSGGDVEGDTEEHSQTISSIGFSYLNTLHNK
jgi:hypothetical protein